MSKNNGRTNPPGSTGREAQAWNAIAESWHSWIPMMRKWYAPATDLMLDLARIGVGSRILDIAAGDCDQSMAAATRVGPQGYVLAVDVSKGLLEIGAQFARDAGFRNIDTRVMDGGNLDLPENCFDAVICRFALMYLPDPEAALRGMKRVLKADGRVSLVVYGTSGSPEFSRAVSVVRRHLRLSETPSPAHSLGELAALEQALAEGGFAGIEIHPMTLPIRMASAEDCVRYLQATSPTLKELTSTLSPDDRKVVWDDVQKALTAYEGNDGFEVLHEVIVAAGTAT